MNNLHQLYNLHNHTDFSDGKNTAEEMVEQALSLGLAVIGFSDHSFVHFDSDYCMPYEKYNAYRAEIRRLKSKYADQIQIFLGIEQDIFSDYPAKNLDYIIGSVHFVCDDNVSDSYCADNSFPADSQFVGIDWGGEEGTQLILEGAERFFHGDVYSLIERYYENVSQVVDVTGADIIGHFDVLAKSNEKFPFFDPQHPRYQAAWQKAADHLIAKNKIFEINLAPIISGHLSQPYPAKEIQDYLRSRGAQFIYNGDCHSVQMLAGFAELLKELPDSPIR